MHSISNLHTPRASGPLKPVLHPSYHLNSTKPDVAMSQSSTFKIGQPEQATWH